MYIELKTDSAAEVERVFASAVEKGQQAMLTLGRDGDFHSLSVNDSVETKGDTTS